MSAMIHMMMTHSRETEGSSMDSIDGALADGDENRTPQGAGRSHDPVR